MLRSVKRLRGQPIIAVDGAIGFIVDVYFDDRSWKVRYFVLDTGRPMPRRQVLVSPSDVVPAEDERIHVRLSRREVERCLELDEDKPVYGPPGRAGHLKDILLDSSGWTVASFVVDDGVWLPGKRSIVAPADVAGLDWIERAVELRAEELRP